MFPSLFEYFIHMREALLAWATDVQQQLHTGVRFAHLMSSLMKTWQQPGSSLLFDDALRDALSLFTHPEDLSLAFNLFLLALCDHGSRHPPPSECAPSFLALLQALCSGLTERGLSAFHKLLGVASQLGTDATREIQTLALSLAHDTVQSEAEEVGVDGDLSSLPKKTLVVGKIVLLAGLRYSDGIDLTAAWRFLRASIYAKHWGTVNDIIMQLFPPQEQGAALDFAIRLAGEGRAGTVLSSMKSSLSRSISHPSPSLGGGAGGGVVDASNAVGVFFVKKGRSTPTGPPPPSHIKESLHPLAAGSAWSLPFTSGGFSIPHPSLLPSPDATALDGSPISPVNGSALVELIGQGHKPAQAGLYSAHPSVSTWKQRSIKCCIAQLNDLPLACTLCRGDGTAGRWLVKYLVRLGREEEAAWVEGALDVKRGGDEGEGGGREEEVEAPPGKPPQHPGRSYWSIPLVLSGGGESPSPLEGGAFFTVVDTLQGLLVMCQELKGCSSVLGLDTEHRPAFYPSPHSHHYPLSLLQVATVSRVYVVDLLACAACVGEGGGEGGLEGLRGAFQCLMGDASVRKVGWGVSEDLKRLHESHGHWLPLGHVAGVVELGVAAKASLSPPPTSLSSLVEATLGLPLNKGLQTSDWQLRPLTWKQLKYAALDALSAVHVAWHHLGESLLATHTTCLSFHPLPSSGGVNFPPPIYTPIPSPHPLCSPFTVSSAVSALGLRPWEALVPKVGSGSVVSGVAINTLALFPPALALLPSSHTVDFSKLPGDYRLATREECVKTFQYEPGTFPPIKGAYPSLSPSLPVFVDALLCGSEEGVLVGGGGGEDHSCVVSPGQLLALNPGCHQALSFSVGRGGSGKGGEDTPLPPPPSGPAQVEEGGGGGGTTLLPPSLPLLPPRLLCDSSLGRLTRWMRVIGIDCESRVGWGADKRLEALQRPGGALSTEEMIEWAASSHRILLTRDSKVLIKGGCPILFVEANDTSAQFVGVCDALAIKVSPNDLMSRCARCCHHGYVELTPKEAEERDEEKIIPDKVLRKMNRFWGCPQCGKLYWEGAKFDETRGLYESMFT